MPGRPRNAAGPRAGPPSNTQGPAKGPGAFQGCPWDTALGVAPPILSWHSLLCGLRRYLIIFDPHTFVLYRRVRAWDLLSLLDVFRGSKNFTSDLGVRIPPLAPIHTLRSLPGPLSGTRGQCPDTWTAIGAYGRGPPKERGTTGACPTTKRDPSRGGPSPCMLPSQALKRQQHTNLLTAGTQASRQGPIPTREDDSLPFRASLFWV